jgi:16S rRNA processing protein RimM
MKESSAATVPSSGDDPMVCVGVITSVHGVKGNVKIRSFTDAPTDIATFHHVFDDSGRQFNISVIIPKKDYMIAAIEGVSSRNDAEGLRNVKLYIKRSELPELANDEFYHADLIGMEARSSDGTLLGTVKNVVNFGAGDILEIYDISSEKIIYYPFKKQFIPAVDAISGVITLLPLEEVIAVDE